MYIEDKPLEYNDASRAWALACEGVVAEMYEDAVIDLAGESSDDNAFLNQFLEVHAMAEALGTALSESHLDALAQATRETALELGIDMMAGAEDFHMFPNGTTCEEDQKGTLEAAAFSQFLRDGAVSGHAAATLTQVVEVSWLHTWHTQLKRRMQSRVWPSVPIHSPSTYVRAGEGASNPILRAAQTSGKRC